MMDIYEDSCSMFFILVQEDSYLVVYVLYSGLAELLS